jgi:hypothetical protein
MPKRALEIDTKCDFHEEIDALLRSYFQSFACGVRQHVLRYVTCAG